MPRRTALMAGVLVVAAAATTVAVHRLGPGAGTSAPADPAAHGAEAPPTFEPDEIDWRPCEDNTSVDCGSVEVPLDWDDPEGPTIDVSVARHPAENPEERVGTAVYLAGGPGDPGAMVLVHADMSAYFSETLMNRFDIVAFDPRGTGNSQPLECSKRLLDNEPDPFLESQQDFEQRVAYNKRLYADCRERSGPLYDHVDTQSVVHDLDAIRSALGEDRLTSIAASYGTAIAQQYAEDYPQRVRAMALDSNVDHSVDTREWVDLKAEMAEGAFDAFVTWCEGDQRCALNGGDNVRATWHDLLDRAEDGAFPHPDQPDRKLRPYDLIKGAYDCSFGPSWSELAGFLNDLHTRGSTSALPCVAEPPEGRPDTRALNKVNFCSDYSLPVSDYREWKVLVTRAGKRHAPDMRVNPNAIDRIADCLGHPTDIPNPQHELDVQGSEPLLLVNAVNDPITGYNQAQRVDRQIGRESVLLTYEGAGHAAYGTTRGSTCTTGIVDTYLITTELPRPGTRCPAVPYEPT